MARIFPDLGKDMNLLQIQEAQQTSDKAREIQTQTRHNQTAENWSQRKNLESREKHQKICWGTMMQLKADLFLIRNHG